VTRRAAARVALPPVGYPRAERIPRQGQGEKPFGSSSRVARGRHHSRARGIRFISPILDSIAEPNLVDYNPAETRFRFSA
jgi:hypothetical protein